MKGNWVKRVVAIVVAAVLLFGVVFSVLSAVLFSASAAGVSAPQTGDSPMIYIAGIALLIALAVIIAAAVAAARRSKRQ